MKRTKLRKKGKQKISTIQNKLWNLCKQIIRKRYGNICYTCGRTGLSGSDWHTAHLIPKSTCGNYLKYDLRNLRPCCYNCNINLGGNGAIYYRKMLTEVGQEKIDELFKDKQKIIKADIIWYTLKLSEYEQIIRELETNNGT